MRQFPIALWALAGCTSLGPLPAVTGASAVPVESPGVELQVAAVPGFYLSDAVKEDPEGEPIRQASALFEPGELIDVPGLAAGARYVTGHGGDGYVEPMLRYRFWLDDDDRVGLALLGYGTHSSGESSGASYTLTRAGLEMAADVRLTPENEWAELHGLGGSSLMALTADGRYCVSSSTGFGVDCPDNVGSREFSDTEIGGFYPAFFTGAALDFGRHLDSPFHGARVVGWLGGGFMPRVRNGDQQDPRGWAEAGLGLSVGVGGK